MKLYTMRYRDKFATTAVVEASTVEKAEELGREHCARKGWRFLSVEDFVMVREEEPKVEEKAVPAVKAEVKKVG